MASPREELSDSFVSRTSDRSGVSTVSASENEVSDDGEVDGPVELIAKKNTTLKVWKYFGFVPDEDGNPINSDKPKYKLCFKSVSVKWANTSNLLSHLKFGHATKYREIKRSEDSSESSTPRRKDKKSLERASKHLWGMFRKPDCLVQIRKNIVNLRVQSLILLSGMLYQFIQWTRQASEI